MLSYTCTTRHLLEEWCLIKHKVFYFVASGWDPTSTYVNATQEH
jgi:hypothetical protein